MIVTSLDLDPAAFAQHTGWELRPEGACRGEVCVPLGGAADDLLAVAARLGMAVVHDEDAGVWALGSDTVSGRALASAQAPDLTLPDREGRAVDLRSFRGQKVLLLAWASW